jgi:hypothetical protein
MENVRINRMVREIMADPAGSCFANMTWAPIDLSAHVKAWAVIAVGSLGLALSPISSLLG